MVLLPYCHKTWNKAYKQASNSFPGATEAQLHVYAWRTLQDELKQGFQSLELKLNTVPCSRGDFAFTTVSFGCWNDPELTNKDKLFLKAVCEAILKTRMNGHGENHKPVVFPKLVYLYDEDCVGGSIEASDVFELAIECSSKCMYPDFLSLTGDWAHSSVGKQYMENKQVVTPMGA